MSDYPEQVLAFHAALGRLAGVQEVDTGLKRLASFSPEDYALPGEFGDLPHTLLRRTGGGLKDEFWANTELVLARTGAGWLTLEFLAWWVRDLSRSGHQIQMRPQGLPPKAYDVQLGRTLKFIIDHFAICPGGDPSPMLALLQERADSLNRGIEMYSDVLSPILDTPETD